MTKMAKLKYDSIHLNIIFHRETVTMFRKGKLLLTLDKKDIDNKDYAEIRTLSKEDVVALRDAAQSLFPVMKTDYAYWRRFIENVMKFLDPYIGKYPAT